MAIVSKQNTEMHKRGGIRTRTINMKVVLSVGLLLFGICLLIIYTILQRAGPAERHTHEIQPHASQIRWPLHIGELNLYSDLNLTINGKKTKGETTIDLVASLNKGDNYQNPLNKGDYYMYQNPLNCGTEMGTNLCLELTNDRRLTIVPVKHAQNGLQCFEINWTATRCVDQVLVDCFDLSSAHWYGGYENGWQPWPFERYKHPMEAFVTNVTKNSFVGPVGERYFITSSGVGIYVNEDVPLYISVNTPQNGRMCLYAKYDKYPYFNHEKKCPFLNYQICHAENILKVHKKMSEIFFDKPRGIPDRKMFRYPIWSTWAYYRANITRSIVMSFAQNIIRNKFKHAQFQIDDNWTPKYGDMTFDENKFPNAPGMIKELNQLGFRVTIWVHPFFNIDSDSFFELSSKRFLIRQYKSELPVLIAWGEGKHAGVFDPSNPEACQWFLDKLQYLRNTFNISSFKFDNGELGFLPPMYSAAKTPTIPTDIYPRAWVQLASDSDKTFHQEVRVGHQTQRFPIFARIYDRFSNWNGKLGLKTIIPTILTFGILGYPFAHSDMIGGHNKPHPDKELFIRWVQLSTFLPAMQFSIPPWVYESEVVNITRKFTHLHEKYADLFIELALESVETGYPIIRPLWWIDPHSEDALLSDDEFLVGERLLVAPVIEPGARQRNIYLPPGSWHDELRDVYVNGGIWLNKYNVDLNELAYFTKLDVHNKD